MPEDTTAGVGAYLREARERAGISVRSIAASTKISVPTIEALERDEVARLPGGIFVRAFVRAYAQEVGLDPEETVRRYVASFPDASAEGSPAPYISNPEKIVVDGEPATGRLWRVVGWSLPLVLVIVYFGFGGRLAWWRPSSLPSALHVEQQTEPAPAGAPVLTTPIAAPSASPSAAPAAGESGAAAAPGAAAPAEPNAAAGDQQARAADTPAPPAPPGPAVNGTTGEGRFELTLAPRRRCWVTVRSDGKILFAGTMNAGDHQDLVLGGNVSLTVGDAGAMDMAINGRPARSLGGEGQVVTARMSLENLDTFLASR